MKLCSFGGRQFDCCKYIQPKMTNMGNCHSLDMRGARDWMQKQTVAGVNAGLQIILDAHMEEQFDGTGGSEYFNTPQCQECKVECNSLAYHAYNSYGHGFSHGALKWLNRKNPEWSKAHMRSNFLTLNVFFRDMAHTEYRQIQATSLTEILSEAFIPLHIWRFSQDSLVAPLTPHVSETASLQEREKQLEETMSTFSMLRTRKNAAGISDSVRVTQSRLRSLSKQIRDSFRKSSKPQGTSAPTPALVSIQGTANGTPQYLNVQEKVEAGTCTDLPEKMLEEQRKQFDDIVENK
ncbi:hypothetical protein ANCCEY_15167, partial [Ancylostoma ceylanicum]